MVTVSSGVLTEADVQSFALVVNLHGELVSRVYNDSSQGDSCAGQDQNDAILSNSYKTMLYQL